MQKLVDYLYDSLPPSTASIVKDLTELGLRHKDALTLATLDNGARLEYFDDVCTSIPACDQLTQHDIAVTTSNWILFELGALLSLDPTTPFSPRSIPASNFADILHHLLTQQIDRPSAKAILRTIYLQPQEDLKTLLAQAVKSNAPSLDSQAMHDQAAKDVIAENPVMVAAITEKGQTRKLQGLLGMMLRRSSVALKPAMAQQSLERLLKS